MTSTIKQLHTIDAFSLKQLLEQKQVTLVDVREPVEYAGEHIAGATLVPLSRFNPKDVPNEPGKELVLYCRSSNRSGDAAQRLLKAGFTEVSHLQGGLEAWKQSGYPVKINKSAPLPLMRQVQIAAGAMVFTGTVLGAFVSPWFLLLSGFVGAGLMFAGISGTCALGMLLAKLPYNQ